MGAQFDNDNIRRMQRMERKKRMRTQKRRQVLFRRILKAGFILLTVLVLAVTVREGVLRYISSEQEAARNAGKEFLTGEREQDAYQNEDVSDENASNENASDENALGDDASGGNDAAGDASGNESGNSAAGGGNETAGKSEGGGKAEGTGGSGNDNEAGSAGGGTSENTAADGTENGNESDAADGNNGSIQNTRYQKTEDTQKIKDEITSGHAVLIDMDTGNILALKSARKRIVPASMTKVLTLLVAAEHLESIGNLKDKFKITAEITDYCYVNGCSVAGFAIKEKVTVRDLFYGTILPSGADAAIGLAEYTAGSQEAFAEMMNEKLEELGLSQTAHFTNCVGIYDENHYCTVLDMAAIMEAALQNEICREVLSARTYTTSKTKQHPDGIEISNWFVRRIEDKDTGGEVLCAKTGYVEQSGNCAVSYGVDKKGRSRICVTTNAPGTWKCIYDHVYLYQEFSKR